MAKKDLYRKLAEKSETSSNADLTKISFKYSDWTNQSFFLHGGTGDYYQQLTSCLQRILETRVGDWTANGPLGHFIKPIDWSHPTIAHSKFRPPGAAEEMLIHCFEIRVSKSHGRLHGFIHMGTFFLVWFDPCHNLFPGTDGGKGKKLAKQEYRQVQNINIETVNNLNARVEELQEKVNRYIDAVGDI